MANDYGFGVSFLPNGDSKFQRPGGPQSGSQAGVAPVQDAVKVLSMRVPRVVGNSPIAPLSLLTSPGGGGMPEGMLQRLMALLGQGPAAAEQPGQAFAQGGVGVTGAPSPFGAGAPPMPQGMGQGMGGGRPPLASVTAGGTAAPPSGPMGAPGGMPQTTQQTPRMPNVIPGQGGGEPAQGSQASDLWELAQRQRGNMGRVMY
jgi:hypothetical protein